MSRWVQAALAEPEPEPEQTPSLEPVGASSRQAGVPAPTQVRARFVAVGAGRLWVLGTHGGAGEETLARLLRADRAGHQWPSRLQGDNARDQVLLVCRSSQKGLESARTAAVEFASGAAGEVDLVGLVISADAPGRLPKPLRDLARVVAGGAPRKWEIPWVEQWRWDPAATAESLPRPAAAVIAELTTLTTRQGDTL